MTEGAMSLDGKRVVVIGGPSGIGFAIAELAPTQGATFVIGSRTEANVSAATARLQGATGRAVDLRDEAGVASFFGEIGPFDHRAITAGDWDTPMFVSARDIDLTRARELFPVLWKIPCAAQTTPAAAESARRSLPGNRQPRVQ